MNVNKTFERVLYGIILLMSEAALFLGIGLLYQNIFKNEVYLKSDNIGEIFIYIMMPFTILAFAYYVRRLYAFDTHLIWEEMRKMLGAVAGAFFVMSVIYIYSFKSSNIIWLIFTLITYMSLDVVLRYYFRTFLYTLGLLRINVAIIGNGFQGEEFATVIKEHKFSNYNLIGFIKYETINGKVNVDKEYLGNFNDVERIIKKYNLTEVVIAVPKIDRQELGKIIEKLEHKIPRIKFIPDMYGLMTFSNQIHDYDKVLAITAAQGLLKPINRFYKRVFDIVGAIIGMLILLPITILSFIMIKIEDGGKVFFKQDRIGINGKKIKIWKFRTMLQNAEKILDELMEKDPAIKEEYLTTKKLKNDPRITKMGNVLRKTSLDEFPQFINVLKGEMSIVGPRPYLFREINDMGDKYKSIIKVKPGITGLWQASGRNELSFEERIVLDQYFVRNWSLWFDIVIVFKTISAVFRAKGVY